MSSKHSKKHSQAKNQVSQDTEVVDEELLPATKKELKKETLIWIVFWVFSAFSMVAVAVMFRGLPEAVPNLLDLDGKPAVCTPKGTLWVIPIINMVLAILVAWKLNPAKKNWGFWMLIASTVSATFAFSTFVQLKLALFGGFTFSPELYLSWILVLIAVLLAVWGGLLLRADAHPKLWVHVPQCTNPDAQSDLQHISGLLFIGAAVVEIIAGTIYGGMIIPVIVTAGIAVVLVTSIIGYGKKLQSRFE